MNVPKGQYQRASVLELILGLALAVSAMACRSWSIATLGLYHSIHIEVSRKLLPLRKRIPRLFPRLLRQSK
jgi:hypothetical protein